MLPPGPQPASPDDVVAHAILGQEHCTPLLDSAGVLRNSQARLFFSDFQFQLVQIIPFSVGVSCAYALPEKANLAIDASGSLNTQKN